MTNALEKNDAQFPQITGNFVANDAVYILGDFDGSISVNVVPKLVDIINRKKNERDASIQVYINSFGGEVPALYSLLCLLQTAKQYGIRIITIVFGRAVSCGSMLAVMGDERKMYRHAMHLAHLGTQFGEVHTNEQIDRTSKKWKLHFKNILDHYHACTGCPKKKLEQILKDDAGWLTPEECLELGFATEII